MKHQTLLVTGRIIETFWEDDNRTPAEVAGLPEIDRNKTYEVSWPDHVLTPRYNGDCIIREYIST